MPTPIVSIIGDISVLSLPRVQVTFIKDCLSWDRKALTHTLVWIPCGTTMEFHQDHCCPSSRTHTGFPRAGTDGRKQRIPAAHILSLVLPRKPNVHIKAERALTDSLSRPLIP